MNAATLMRGEHEAVCPEPCTLLSNTVLKQDRSPLNSEALDLRERSSVMTPLLTEILRYRPRFAQPLPTDDVVSDL